MPLYLMLTTLTEKGVQTLNSNPARVREVNRDVEELGARILHQWASLGAYDFVNIVEAPDDLTIAKVSVALGARGSSKLESLPLLPSRICSPRSRRRPACRPSAAPEAGHEHGPSSVSASLQGDRR